MSSLLNLQGVIIYQITENEQGFFVKIGQPRRPAYCPLCKSKNIEKHSKGKIRSIRHGINLSNKPIYLLWKNSRFKCKDCKKTWTLRPSSAIVQGKQRSTVLCQKQALKILQTNSFGNTKKQSGLSYPALRSSLHRFMSQIHYRIPDNGDLIIGIDEHSRARHKLATTITLLKPERKLLAILPQTTATSLVSWANQHMTEEQRNRVIEIGMDMTKSLKKQLRNLFPNACFVIDQFHVISYLNKVIAKEYTLSKKNLSQFKQSMLYREKGLGFIRLLYQGGDHWTLLQKEKVSRVFMLMPDIAKLWYIKEEARVIYRECKNKDEARKRWFYILGNLPELPQRTLTKFLEEILNYFDNYTTNAFTEGVHTKFKLIKRLSFGLRNPQVYIEKLMLGFIEPYLITLPHTY